MAAEAIQRTQSEIYLEKYVIQLTSKQQKKIDLQNWMEW